ncbi:hypothetical protein RhiJN_22082 [Ceratobasidium sp. AG-Ba]|nr:hypothetical protein RhiJN_22082 [Ceratobasidium sp. AG-Ba]
MSQYFAGPTNSGNAFALYGAAQSPRDTQSELRSLMRPNSSDSYSAQSSRGSSAASLASSSASAKCKTILTITGTDERTDAFYEGALPVVSGRPTGD